jgi:hypothetical protein
MIMENGVLLLGIKSIGPKIQNGSLGKKLSLTCPKNVVRI